MFEKYVLGGVTYENLSFWSGLTIQTLVSQFHVLLNQVPPDLKIPELNREETYLLIDALWFGKRFCLMLYRHSKEKKLLHSSFLSKEFGSLIAKDLQILKTKYRFTCIVLDGGTRIRNAVFKVFGCIPHQICMAHLHRDIVNAMGRYPKDERVKKLKRIADHI